VSAETRTGVSSPLERIARFTLTPKDAAGPFDLRQHGHVRAPNNRGLGFVWWYPEAIPVPGRHIWRGGAEALFDDKGAALPALDTFGEVLRTAR
jgi:hypothetical protein